MAKNCHWGVDSAAPVTHKITVKGKQITLFDFVVQELKRMPEFWGRYVGGRHEITPAEADYIFTKSKGACRILVVYNGAHDSTSSVRGNYQAGVRDAQKAINAATKVGVPKERTVMIWGDVEGAWQPSSDWFIGWWDTMHQSPYAGMGGIYCRPNIPQFYKPYCEALKRSFSETRIPYLLDPFAKKGKDQKIYAFPLDPPDKLRLLWGTRPQKSGWSNPSIDGFSFAPAEPPDLPGRVALWQYHIDFLKTGSSRYGLIDMDLADDRAYDLMWTGGPSS